MIIKFKFDDGTISEVEVDDETGQKYLEEERKIENANRKERYWVKAHLDSMDYEGELFQSPYPNPLDQVIIDEEQRRVDEFKETLTEIQRRRLEKLLVGMSQIEIVRDENTTHRAVQKTIEQLKTKYKKFFNK